MTHTDYSIDRGVYRPHDLLWIDADALEAEAEAPEWARATCANGSPVVVRRAPRARGRLPIGVRGSSRSERHASVIDIARVRRCVSPEQLADRRGARVPALAIIDRVAGLLDRAGVFWGITGAVGYELATAQPVCQQGSDLDLMLRAPTPAPRAWARRLYQQLAALPVRCDLQLETPVGAVALADWAGDAARVLVKSDEGPFLSCDPWADDSEPSILPSEALARG